MPVDRELATQLHAVFAWIVVALAVVLSWACASWTPPWGPGAPRGSVLVLLAQGVIGYVQYFTDLPEMLVGLHMLGSTLVWIGVLRVLLSTRERGLPADAQDAVPVSESAAAPPLADLATRG